jgi:hypothetical protein
MPEIVDLRGHQALPVAAPVLVDLSGRRARVLTRAGRGIAIILLLWLTGLVLAGLGLLPASDLPLSRAVAGRVGPSVLRALPPGAPPVRADLVPARPAVPPRLAQFSGGSAGSGGIRTLRPGPASGLVAQPQRQGRYGGASGLRHGVGGGPPSSGSGGGHAAGAIGSGAGSAIAGAIGAPAGSASTGSGSGGGLGRARGSGGGSTTHGRSSHGHGSSSPAGNSGSAPGRGQQTTTTTSTATTASTTTRGQSGSAPGHTIPRGNGYGSGG